MGLKCSVALISPCKIHLLQTPLTSVNPLLHAHFKGAPEHAAWVSVQSSVLVVQVAPSAIAAFAGQRFA